MKSYIGEIGLVRIADAVNTFADNLTVLAQLPGALCVELRTTGQMLDCYFSNDGKLELILDARTVALVWK